MNKLLNDMFDEIFAINRAPVTEKSVYTNGFKNIIPRPHNLYAIKDENGNTTSHRIELVTTPFKKGDVKIEIVGDTMTVACGSDNFVEENSESVIYHGISSQSFSFSIKLRNIDQKKITAKNEDGILRIDLPILKKNEPEVMTINID